MRLARSTGASPSFVHDLNTCVGCHACAIACANEQQLAPGRSWRHVVTFNPGRHPGLPTFHLSLACNHCLDAPCERYCPARAIERDARTGAVVIDARRCIGCRYCSWVCPYDAPRFDAARGVMEKCTFCTHRLAEGLAPACVTACPTGALRAGAFAPGATYDVPGFPRADVRPAISFVPLGRGTPSQATSTHEVRPGAVADPAPPVVSLRGEWSLAAFTSATLGLVGWVAASLAGGPPVAPLALALVGLLAAALSTSHLGRPARAWRASLNWRRSWLSREVVSFGAFLATATAAAALSIDWLRAIAAVVGVTCLVSMDRVYAVMARERRPALDGVTLLSGGVAFAVALAGGTWWVGLPLLAIRAATTWARWSWGPARPSGAWLGAARLVLLAASAGAWVSGLESYRVAALLCASEVADRLHFYDALDVVTPRARVAADLEEALARGAAPRPDSGPQAITTASDRRGHGR